uniref:Uncharacterized protein n=1 Tax=Arundo donax TaxID=35708 RepID=A0A0A9H736_ARUDO
MNMTPSQPSTSKYIKAKVVILYNITASTRPAELKGIMNMTPSQPSTSK